MSWEHWDCARQGRDRSRPEATGQKIEGPWLGGISGEDRGSPEASWTWLFLAIESPARQAHGLAATMRDDKGDHANGKQDTWAAEGSE